MSLMRRFSKRLTGSSKKEDGSSSRKSKTDKPKQVTLQDNPVPTTRTMTTANLFQPVKTSSSQATAMDRTLYEIPQPDKVDAMTDLIKDHSRGEFFPYVGVVGSEGESSDARRARMLALKPSYNKRDIPEIKVLGCPLISREGDFTMESLMSFAKANTEQVPASGAPVPGGAHSPNYTITKPYVHIRQVTVLYTPNMSSTSNYCNFWMNLVDNRLIDSDKGSQTNVIVSNQEGILEMSCDYCVSTADLKSFTLSYSLERDIVHPGFQWGTASFYFSITESDLPYQSSKVDAMAVYRMPITTLMDRKTNADKSDISFTPADLVRLRELYSQGDIVDVDQPQTARVKTNTYAKSSVRSKPKGEKLETAGKPGWEFMEGARRQRVDAFEASVDVDDDSSVEVPEIDLEAAKASRKSALERYKARQETERKGFVKSLTHSSVKSGDSPEEKQVVITEDKEDSDELTRFFGSPKSKKQVRMNVSDV